MAPRHADRIMIISQSQIQLAARGTYRETSSVQERLIIQARPVTRKEPPSASTPAAPVPARPPAFVATRATQRQQLDLSAAVSANGRLQLLIIAQLYREITGRELKLSTPEQLPGAPAAAALDLPASTPAPPVTGLVYERRTHYAESEAFQFAAQGKVLTRDGREIAISASLTMSRSFVATSSLTLAAGGGAVMTDPLVINFDGTGAQLETTRFAFDLDSDGTPEQIANLRPNSGYLALDRNGDGVINNGRELFGPVSNDGFAELAAYDGDGNGFIDEVDAIYDQLRIWQRRSDGESRLLALGDARIGAIYLGHTQTALQLKDERNNSLGEVVSSGVYLREDGSTGIVQQINLAV